MVQKCNAIAAAVLGFDAKVELFQISYDEQPGDLVSGMVDLNNNGYIATMEREVNPDFPRHHIDFAPPHVYFYTKVFGERKNVECFQDSFNVLQECSDTVVCGAGIKYDQVKNTMPKHNVFQAPNDGVSREALLNHTCNVVVAIAFPPELSANYTGDFYVSDKPFPGLLPLAIATVAKDPEWSAFVNWVMQALFAAEQHGITKDNVDLHYGNKGDGLQLAQVTAFGEDYKDMFYNAIKAAGNIGNFWGKINPATFPRSSINFPVVGPSSGVMSSWPPGLVEEVGPDPVPYGILSNVSSRGHLRCGVRMYENGSFAVHPSQNNKTESSFYQGMDVDYCRAVAAATFSSGNSVEFVELKSDEEGFLLLHNSSIDIFAGVAMNLERNVREPTTGVGFAFSKPYFYNNTSFFSTSTR